MYPQYEVRTAEQLKADRIKAEEILGKENKVSAKKVSQVKAKSEKKGTKQKGRGSLYATFTDFEYFKSLEEARNITYDQIDLCDIGAELTVGVGKFGFVGFTFDYDNLNSEEENIMRYGLVNGLNVRFGKFRPYVQAQAQYSTDYRMIFSLGGGMDFIMAGPLMLNFGYKYNYDYDFDDYLHLEENVLTGEEPDIIKSKYHSFSIGAGFAW